MCITGQYYAQQNQSSRGPLRFSTRQIFSSSNIYGELARFKFHTKGELESVRDSVCETLCGAMSEYGLCENQDIPNPARLKMFACNVLLVLGFPDSFKSSHSSLFR